MSSTLINVSNTVQKWYNYLVSPKEEDNLKGPNLMQCESINNNNIIICQQLQTRRFTKFEHISDLVNFASITKYSHNCFFEVIRASQPQKFYVDIDIEIDEDTVYSEEESVKRSPNSLTDFIENFTEVKDFTMKSSDTQQVVLEVKNALMKLFPLIKDSDMFVTFSNNQSRHSYHIILDNWCAYNNKENRAIFESVIKSIPQRYVKALDNSMYKSIQQFRLYNSHKFESTRDKIFCDELSTWKPSSKPIDDKHLERLRFLNSIITNTSSCAYLPSLMSNTQPINIKHENSIITKEIATHAMDLFKESFPDSDSFSYNGINGCFISLTRKRPSMCLVCKRIHKAENPYIIISGKDNSIYFDCRRSSDGSKHYIGQLGNSSNNQHVEHQDDKRDNKKDEYFNNENMTMENILKGFSVHSEVKVDTPKPKPKPQKIDVDDAPDFEDYVVEDLTFEDTHKGIAKLFMAEYSDRIKVISTGPAYYIWNIDKLLWELKLQQNMIKLIGDSMEILYISKRKSFYKKLEECHKDNKSRRETLEIKIKEITKVIKSLGSAPYLKNIVTIVAAYDFDPDFQIKIINRSENAVPVKGGKVINLETLEIRTRTIEDYWDFELNANFIEDCNFETNVLPFFRSITLNSPALIDYHRRMWGYLMTGSITGRSFHIFYGDGCNGKSSIVNIFKNITGKFSYSLNEDIVKKSKKNSGTATPEMMGLLYPRCGFLPESGKDEELNDERIKNITGDDNINARGIYKDAIEFKTQCKPILCTNHKPKINAEDKAILDRIRLVPFMARFENTTANSKYIKDLQINKLDEFFTWFCIGARDYINGADLIPCKEMEIEMTKYIGENNPIAKFIDSYVLIKREKYDLMGNDEKSKWRYPRTEIYSDYEFWARENEVDKIKKGEFYAIMLTKSSTLQEDGIQCYTCRKKEHFQIVSPKEGEPIVNSLAELKKLKKLN